jgi:hypothetical protein
MIESQACQTPVEDLRKVALKHYDSASTKVQLWNNAIPRAINFYYDYKQMSIWQKLKLILKQ